MVRTRFALASNDVVANCPTHELVALDPKTSLDFLVPRPVTQVTNNKKKLWNQIENSSLLTVCLLSLKIGILMKTKAKCNTLFSYVTSWLFIEGIIFVHGNQKLRQWMGNPSWSTGITPASRFYAGFTTVNDDLYLFGGATSLNGIHLLILLAFCSDLSILPQNPSEIFTSSMSTLRRGSTYLTRCKELFRQLDLVMAWLV